MARRKAKRRAPVPPARDLHPYLLPAVLLVALAARIYVFALTADQPLWWDEAEYVLKARNMALGTPDTGYTPGRPIVLSIAFAGVYAVGLDEPGLHVFVAAVALAAVWLVYRVGRRLFGTHAGFVAALLFSVFYLPLFYGARFLTEMPQVTLCLLAADLVTAGTPARLVLAAPVLAVAVLTRFPAGLMLPILFVYALAHERARLLRSRAVLVAAALGLVSLAPYFGWAWLHYGDPLYTFKAWGFTMPRMTPADRLAGVGDYAGLVWAGLGWGLGTPLVGGIVLCSRVLIAPGRLWRNGDPTWAGGLLVLAWLLLPFLYFALFVRPVLDRYPILGVPALFLAIGVATAWVATRLARGHALAETMLVVAVAGLGAIGLARDADTIVRSKITSQAGMRDAGRWIAAHTEPADTVMSSSVAQLTYYSVRPILAFPKDADEFARILREQPPRYVVVSGSEQDPAGLEAMLSNLAVAGRFPPERPTVVVFRPERVP
jgi:4-amino-4-deoxy-L-arabinose transferase-like glycosyltransferase